MYDPERRTTAWVHGAIGGAVGFGLGLLRTLGANGRPFVDVWPEAAGNAFVLGVMFWATHRFGTPNYLRAAGAGAALGVLLGLPGALLVGLPGAALGAALGYLVGTTWYAAWSGRRLEEGERLELERAMFEGRPFEPPGEWAVGKWAGRLAAVVALMSLSVFVREEVSSALQASRGAGELAAAVAEADAIDPRWRWADLVADRPAVPDERNVLLRARAVSEALRGTSFDKDRAELLGGERAKNAALPAEELARLRGLLAVYGDAVALARSAADLPTGRADVPVTSRFRGSILAHVTDAERAVWLNRYALEADLADARPADAARCVVAQLNLADALLNGPAFANEAASCTRLRTGAALSAERLLARSTLPAAALERLQARLFASSGSDALRAGLRGGRAAAEELAGRVASGEMAPGELFGTGVAEKRDWLFERRFRRVLDSDRAFALSRYGRFLAASEQPIEGRKAALLAAGLDINALTNKPTAGRLFSLATLMDAPLLAFGAERASERVRLSVLALGAERFRLERGDWPASTADLFPAFMPAGAVAAEYAAFQWSRVRGRLVPTPPARDPAERDTSIVIPNARPPKPEPLTLYPVGER